MSSSPAERRLWQCPNCSRQYRIPVDADPMVCVECEGAFSSQRPEPPPEVPQTEAIAGTQPQTEKPRSALQMPVPWWALAAIVGGLWGFLLLAGWMGLFGAAVEDANEVQEQQNKLLAERARLEGSIASRAIADAAKIENTGARQEVSVPAQSLLAADGLSFRRQYQHVFVSGNVSNLSGRTLEHVLAVAEFWTADGKFVKSSEALLTFDPLLPGQSSPFEVSTQDNPAIARYGLRFRMIGGRELPADVTY